MREVFRELNGNFETEGVGNHDEYTIALTHVRRNVSPIKIPLFIYFRNIAERV
ncbi:hypothetical protein D3C76_1256090 [compost metagenome]